MSRKIKIGAIQMDATPFPTLDRLARAAELVSEATASGAELVVLPECFNTGYAYVDSNYKVSEPIEGQTVTWMKEQAKEHNIHLIGSLMLCDDGEVYNSALLFAPDGRMWRYDKRYPFNWERAYFREGDQITVADTDLGQFGMMICWDSAHADLWQEYAGKVDAMLIPSCPPRFNDDAEIVFSNGKRAKGWVKTTHFADNDIHDQASWLKIPVVHASGNGTFRSPIPLPRISLMGLLAGRPSAWVNIPFGTDAQFEVPFGQHTQIINADGEVVGRVDTDSDGYTMAEVDLPEKRQNPEGVQPKMRTSSLVFLLNDVLAPLLHRFIYRSGMRRKSVC